MTGTRKSRNDLACSNQGRTVGDLLEEHEETTHLLAEDSIKRQVSVIVLCDGATPFDEEVLGATPHITLRMEDDLLHKIKELHEQNMKLRSLSLIDNLTGLSNKRFFWMQLETEMARTKRTGHSCTLMMIDLDNFKCLNDTFGHLEGDRFLEEFGRIMHDNSRSTDLPCRYGGDEFALIMPATSVTEATKTGERLKNMLADMPQKSDPPISLSIGISEYTTFSTYDMNEFVRAADMAMYEAKGGGKNQVRVDRNWREITLEDNEVNRDEKDALFTDY
jgi:two-component system cell cycle response regulator